ncbi:ABC transporter substrate-binding protein [Subtercola sp. Z020]|uniref:iron-siderophore ABC transporter substrate-binding protein n=1 Tax=Subtercola sp. Z020 TaxID=2080582 RepID=UPI000CE7254F|nr:iron-siderophore ABC transporter substrate-binding protein [Subtercola sp. Z020]PPF84115.1 ABC transporter substrate-binding protein [Subtercola sp. Z020]
MRARFLRTTTVVAATAAALLALSGCASGAGSSEPSSSAASGSLGTVDTMFGTVDVPRPEGDLKVVALGWSDAEMALALGVKPVGVYAWQGFTADTKGVGPWASSLFGDVVPEQLGGGETLNYEQIAALDPDVILNVRSDNDEETYKRLSEIAPTVYAPTGTGPFATDWATQLTSVSEALGLADEGTALISTTKADIAAAAAANPSFAGKTAVSAAKFGEAYGAYLPGDGRFDILADLGFVSAPAVTALGAGSFYATVSVENVSALDADVMVALPIGFTAAETEADPLLASLPVVQQGRTVFLDPTSETATAYSAASVLSIPVVLDQLVPLLAAAAAK